MSYQYTNKKAITTVDIGDVTDTFGRKGRRVLEIETSKGYSRGTLKTSASVFTHGSGFKTHAFGFGSGGDFSLNIKTTTCPRVTEKAVRAQHEALAPEFAEVERKAREHYQAKEEVAA